MAGKEDGSGGADSDAAGGSDWLARMISGLECQAETNLAELARAVLGAANAGVGGGGGGLGKAIADAVGGLFGGARAEGGPVVGGGAYLVGERGPEVFRPAGAGTIEQGGSGLGGAAPVTVNLRLDGGAPDLLRSETQIAQMLARAVALGSRRF